MPVFLTAVSPGFERYFLAHRRHIIIFLATETKAQLAYKELEMEWEKVLEKSGKNKNSDAQLHCQDIV